MSACSLVAFVPMRRSLAQFFQTKLKRPIRRWASARFPPRSGRTRSRGARAEYDSQLAEMRLRLTASESALVLFHPDQLREGMPTVEELTKGSKLSAQTEVGGTYLDPGQMIGP